MSIQEMNHYNSQNYYDITTKTNQANKREETAASSKSKANITNHVEKSNKDTDNSTQKYLEELRKKNSQINIFSGNQDTGRRGGSNSKTDVMIAPSILKQMASDPEAASKYEKMLADIPGLDKWANSMIHAMTGSEVKYRQVWIDEDGNMGAFAITGPSEETKKAEEQAKQKEKEEYQNRMKERREKYQEFSERWNKGNKDPAESAYMESIMKLRSVDYKA